MMLFHVWETSGTCIKPEVSFDSGQKGCVCTRNFNVPGSILWHWGYGQPMTVSYNSYSPKEGGHIQSVLWDLSLCCVFPWQCQGECWQACAKPLPRICLIIELQKQLKSTVWDCFLVLINLLMWKWPKRNVWLFISGYPVYWGSALQLMHLMHFETHFVLSLLKTLFRFCIKMTPVLLLHMSWGGEKGKATVHEALWWWCWKSLPFPWDIFCPYFEISGDDSDFFSP